jgi:predicted ATPase
MTLKQQQHQQKTKTTIKTQQVRKDIIAGQNIGRNGGRGDRDISDSYQSSEWCWNRSDGLHHNVHDNDVLPKINIVVHKLWN